MQDGVRHHLALEVLEFQSNPPALRAPQIARSLEEAVSLCLESALNVLIPVTDKLSNSVVIGRESLKHNVDELQAAIKATVEKRLKAAVEEGKITQSEADHILQRVDEGLPFFGGPMGRPSRPAQ